MRVLMDGDSFRQEGAQMKTFTIIVLTSVFWLVVIGIMTIDHRRAQWEALSDANVDNYICRQQVNKLHKENVRMYRHIAEIKGR